MKTAPRYRRPKPGEFGGSDGVFPPDPPGAGKKKRPRKKKKVDA